MCSALFSGEVIKMLSPTNQIDSLELLMPQVVALARNAGDAVMEIYSQEDFGTTYKENDSPLTRADMAAHRLILDQLQVLTPSFPTLSEESKAAPYESRQNWGTFWLIDPLDGTKEFIKRNGEFTVNIALIENGEPVLGVVYAPALDITYWAAKGLGAFKRTKDNVTEQIRVSDYREGTLKIVASRSHAGESLTQLLERISNYECVSMGSSLKLCLVAEGTAHLYPRLGPTMEWDVAAAQCVVTEAGGTVTDLAGHSLEYNKPNLLNPHFIVCGSPAYPCDRLYHR
jgi:3'(2'), 5'-bisphosphate nucleotidase